VGIKELDFRIVCISFFGELKMPVLSIHRASKCPHHRRTALKPVNARSTFNINGNKHAKAKTLHTPKEAAVHGDPS